MYHIHSKKKPVKLWKNICLIFCDFGQFNEDDPLQQNVCGAGEACLWYSWQKSAGETSFIRNLSSPPVVISRGYFVKTFDPNVFYYTGRILLHFVEFQCLIVELEDIDIKNSTNNNLALSYASIKDGTILYA